MCLSEHPLFKKHFNTAIQVPGTDRLAAFDWASRKTIYELALLAELEPHELQALHEIEL